MNRDVFLSRPTSLTPEQRAFTGELQRDLESRGITVHTLGVTDYPNIAPVRAVLDVLRRCDGAVILGFVQLHVEAAVERPGTPRERPLAAMDLATPWNQLEAGMAFALGLPLLIMRQPTIYGGIFDAGSTDRYVHRIDLSLDWLREPAYYQPLNAWLDEIAAR